ncbi:MAG: DUF669 domain-containing protein [Planctomycetaceae bacterium]
MASFGGTFDATVIEPSSGGSSPVPAGMYRVAIIKSEWKDTKNKQGQFLELVLEILQGEYKGRRLYARLNLRNRSSDAVRIAQSELSAICHATGVLKPADSAQLHNVPLVVAVKLEKRKDNGENSNVIDRYLSTEAATKEQADRAAAPAATATAPATEKAPWEK